MSSTDLPSILFVDDDREVRFLLEKTLEGTFEVVSAGSAGEALAVLGNEEPGDGERESGNREPVFCDSQPDLFLLDIRLPGGRDGVELLHLLQDFGLAESAPAVALTTYARREERRALLAEGFDGHVSKPFRREELVGALRRALRPADACRTGLQ
ncbi:response regulator [Salinibacter grassmerensis]|uniref:response regulator n=1 Tax=Salinibacter grassmerensis TaxID=3040353 RepID=UPI0021E8C93B|nr:response regulator [Salinibacter grassmerensis]